MASSATLPTTAKSHSEVSTVEIVIPVYNEERILEASVRELRTYLDDRFPFSAVITIADNASTDHTHEIAASLASDLDGVRVVHLGEKGRGRALRQVWSASEAAVVAYMDVDLATDLDGLLPLVAPLLSGHSDLAIGTRLARGSRVQRGPKREMISRAYNLLIRTTMRSGFTDAQCGFKALRREAAQRLLPLVADQGWFFDTELLILGEANGMRIHEVPVDWIDDTDSRVHVVSTATGDLRGLWRVRRSLARGEGRVTDRRHLSADQAARFGGIGGVSTLAYLALLLGLCPLIGLLLANVAALALTSVANGVAHARLTVPSSEAGGRHEERRALLREAAGALVAGLVLSSTLLFALSQLTTGLVAVAVVALGANAAVSAGRFVSYRGRMFHRSLAEDDAR